MQIAPIEIVPKRHSQTGASGYHRWRSEACPGSVRQIRNHAPPDLDLDDEVRDDGIEAHALAEGIQKCRTKEERAVYRATYNNRGGDLKIILAVAKYVAFVDYLAGICPAAELLVEAEFNLDWLAKAPVLDEHGQPTGEDESCLYGTSDAIVYQPTGKYYDPNGDKYLEGPILHVVDLKYGFKRVEARENPQALYYALGAYAHYRSQGRDIKHVVVHIWQPRVMGLEQEGLSWACDVPYLENFALKLKDDVLATMEPDAPLNADKDWCRLCRARTTCPEIARPAYDIASLQLVQLGKNPATELPPLELLMKDRAAQYKMAQLASVYATSVVERTRAEMNRGETVPGLKLVNGRNSKYLINGEAFFNEFPAKDWPELYTEPVVKSAAGILEVLKDDPDFKPADIAAIEKKYIRKSKGTPLVALESDPRPAYVAVTEVKNEWAEEIAQAHKTFVRVVSTPVPLPLPIPGPNGYPPPLPISLPPPPLPVAPPPPPPVLLTGKLF